MDIHYDNPNQLQVIDNSGFRYWYTETLRPIDAGIMEVGHPSTSSFSIPPGQPAYGLTGWAPSMCTQTYFPPEGIQISNVFLHTHMLGRAMILRHFRNGVELKPILGEPYYDFNYQEFVPVNVTVLPGDALRLDCTYNSMSRTEPTELGLRTRNEMCLAFIQYYPKLNPEFGARSWADPAGGISGHCRDMQYTNYQVPTFGPYVPPPCNRIAPDPSRLTPTRVDNPVDVSKYDRSIILDPEQKYKLYWKVDRTNQIIHGAVEVQTTGWIGFGLTTLGMEGADVFIGYIDEYGNVQFAIDLLK
jgi:hypothetical protein